LSSDLRFNEIDCSVPFLSETVIPLFPGLTLVKAPRSDARIVSGREPLYI
jgi:hypothetical protein